MKKIITISLLLTISVFSDIKISPNTSLNGSELFVKNNIYLLTCMTLCESNKKCVGINYKHNNKRCGLLKSYTGRVNVQGISSGLNYYDYDRISKSFDKGTKKVVNNDYAETIFIPDNSYAKTVPIEDSEYTYTKKDSKYQKSKYIEETVPKKISYTDKLSSAGKEVKDTFEKMFNSVKNTINQNLNNEEIKPSKNNISESTTFSDKNIISAYNKKPSRSNVPTKEPVISTIKKENITSSNSFVTEFSNTPIKRKLVCELYDSKKKLIVSRKCIVKEFFFDDKIKVSINFINGAPFRFLRFKDGRVFYLKEGDDKKSFAAFYKNRNRGVFRFDHQKLVYFE